MSGRTGFAPDVAAGILLRDAEKCAMAGHPLCRGGRATEANHRLNRQSGGDPRPIVNSPANGVAMEHACNWRLEVNAGFAEEARRRGVKLDHSGDDAAAIVGTPFWSPLFSQWAVLRPGGMYLTGDIDGSRDARSASVVGNEESGFAIVWNVPGAVDSHAFEATGAGA